jgi:UDP-N-acetylmuramate dehydrogenase
MPVPEARPRVNIEEQVALAPLTSLRVGGPARWFARCASVDDLREALAWARTRGCGVHVLGGGSNTLFDDAGFDGLVIHVGLRGIERVDDGDQARVTAAGGEDWDGFVARCIDEDLGGLECLSGIPGLVGATPMQNVGAYGQEVAETIVEVQGIDRATGEAVRFGRDDCAFAYRSSRFKADDRDRFVLTAVTYRLPVARRPEIRYAELARRLEADGIDLDGLPPGRDAGCAVRAAVLAVRRGKSMVLDPADPDARSAGSFFLNPTLTDEQLRALRERWEARGGDADDVPVFPAAGGHKVPAAWLVERAGFARGTRHGGAGISSKHALALVSHGDRAADVRALAARVRDGVCEAFGIELEQEPVSVPAAGVGPIRGG